MAEVELDLEGELYTDQTTRLLYATDASAYREVPLAVAVPNSRADIQKLIKYARSKSLSIIPRTAGTSLAGQVVGSGIVVDVSKHFNRILELNQNERWVRVEPGVIRDDLNVFLRKHGLFFGPETSTANRAMIGGMVGNNSCGSNSIVYGSTREHIIELSAFLSDASEVTFRALTLDEFHNKCEASTLEGQVYRTIRKLLSDHNNQQEIIREFPRKSIQRRNTGYAVDILAEMAPFNAGGPDFDFCKLIAGSEGTLAFITEIKLNVVPLPPQEVGLLCVHFNTIDEALRANLIGLKYKPSASELIDHYILECTKNNIEQCKNRFFVQGDPGAILVIEFNRSNPDEIVETARQVEAELRSVGLGYHFPLVMTDQSKKVWTLRKAGLGLLGNLPGDEKAVPVIEDTAVDVHDLPAYIKEFNEILTRYNLYSVHYAHAGSGELHLRPIINLKTPQGNELFRKIAEEIALLVKKYKGSLSGEHGDGRLRGEFIRQMVGEKNYQILKQIKSSFDPYNIFNPGKIVDTPPMNSMLRYVPGQTTPQFKTYFRYHNQDVLQHAEQCNGSGDCRKTHIAGGTMCPSYMATRNERDTTRARANILREFLTNSTKLNRFDHKEIYDVMDLCLSCKGCKSECPSNVDMAKLKAEFLQNYYDANGTPLRAKLIGNFTKISRLASVTPALYNSLLRNRVTSRAIKKISGFAQARSLPAIHKTTFYQWFQRRRDLPKGDRQVFLLCDEFTNYNDVEIGIKCVLLLERLGYEVKMPPLLESGRTWLSKGLVKKARSIANSNISILAPIIGDSPIVGIEPSALLTLRDEYPDLAFDDNLESARKLAARSFLIDEFLAAEADAGRLESAQFHLDKKKIVVHGHCQQKALSSVEHTLKILSLPKNYDVKAIPSGCCGMAGSFGYEKEHYELSMQIGELILFPTIRDLDNEVLIAAPGTSCRHQILDGTNVKAYHPVEILYQALI